MRKDANHFYPLGSQNASAIGHIIVYFTLPPQGNGGVKDFQRLFNFVRVTAELFVQVHQCKILLIVVQVKFLCTEC